MDLTERQVEPREIYFYEGIKYIPKILELVDKNRLSKTYGCFDRSFWHYRTSDFPSGMYQEAVLPLTLAYTINHPANPFYQEERLKELVWAGIEFARKSSHRDGSCDDYFPYERASGATAFSLYACTEAAILLGFTDEAFLQFFKKRANYLAQSGFEESGILSNHKALIVLALYNVFLLTGENDFLVHAERRLGDLLRLQKAEGWFPEYEGCDPGYLTFTIDFLAKYYEKSKDKRVLNPLWRAIEFSAFFMHPDGSYGGEYGSRNTFHFMPHGFEIMAPIIPPAYPLVDQFLDSLKSGNRSYLEDDRLFSHYVYNFFQAYQAYTTRPQNSHSVLAERKFSEFFKEAGLLVKKTKQNYAVLSIFKGGAGKIYKNGELCYSDCGLVGSTKNGKRFISQIVGDFSHEWKDGKLVIEGYCYEYKDLVFSPLLFLLFRSFLNLIGRFLPPNFVRSLIQAKVILKKKKKFPLRFRKEIDTESFDEVTYHFFLEKKSIRLSELWIATDATFIYVATSQPYQKGSLESWIDLSSILPWLHQNRKALFRHPLS